MCVRVRVRVRVRVCVDRKRETGAIVMVQNVIISSKCTCYVSIKEAK